MTALHGISLGLEASWGLPSSASKTIFVYSLGEYPGPSADSATQTCASPLRVSWGKSLTSPVQMPHTWLPGTVAAVKNKHRRKGETRIVSSLCFSTTLAIQILHSTCYLNIGIFFTLTPCLIRVEIKCHVVSLDVVFYM